MENYLIGSMTNIAYSKALPLVDSNERDWTKLLWVAVLERAIHDAFYQNDYKEAREALEWLDKKNEDFQLVCQLAGTDADYIIRKLFVKIKKKKNFFKNIKDGSNFFIQNKHFEEELKCIDTK